MNPKIFYRVGSKDTTQGLWYDMDGNFTGLIHKEFDFCTNKDLQMPFSEKAVGKLSAVEALEELFAWFTEEDIKKLEEFGYSILMYEADSYEKTEGHWFIDKETSLKMLEIPLIDVKGFKRKIEKIKALLADAEATLNLARKRSGILYDEDGWYGNKIELKLNYGEKQLPIEHLVLTETQWNDYLYKYEKLEDLRHERDLQKQQKDLLERKKSQYFALKKELGF